MTLNDQNREPPASSARVAADRWRERVRRLAEGPRLLRALRERRNSFDRLDDRGGREDRRERVLGRPTRVRERGRADQRGTRRGCVPRPRLGEHVPLPDDADSRSGGRRPLHPEGPVAPDLAGGPDEARADPDRTIRERLHAETDGPARRGRPGGRGSKGPGSPWRRLRLRLPRENGRRAQLAREGDDPGTPEARRRRRDP